MTLDELLADASVTDDLEVTFGDKGKFKLGDLRSGSKAGKTKLDAELAKLAKQQSGLETLSMEAAKLLEGLRAAPVPTKTAEGKIDFDADPLYGPLMKDIIAPIRAEQAKLLTAAQTIKQSFDDSAKFLLTDYYERRWASIPAERRPKDKGWKDYVKLAAEKKLLNEFNMPDPVAALEAELSPVEKTAAQTKINSLEAQVAELTKQLSTPAMPRPGSMQLPGTPERGKSEKTFDSAEALVDAAFADPVIQSIIQGAGKA